MGYYTNYEIDIIAKNAKEYTDISFSLLNTFTFISDDLKTDSIKWYSHEKELKEFSVKYPNSVIVLKGIGEDHYFNDLKINADIWIKYFKNGKCYKDTLNFIFSEFDDSKLNE